MFSMRWRLVRLLGIPISVDASWLIILALLTVSLANIFHDQKTLKTICPVDLPPLPSYQYWIMALVTALAFFVCILLHEFGHALVARSRGMPIRGITLFLFGGVAELGDEPVTAATEFLMAVAGPLVSVVLACAFYLLFSVGHFEGWPEPIVVVLFYLAFINGGVLIFNLIPAFPLDGGRVFRSILWGITGNQLSATYWASLAGRGFAWVLVAVGILEIITTGSLWGSLWLMLIAWFLNNAARSGYQQVLVRHALAGQPIRRLMNPDPIVVPPSLDLQHWVEDFIYRYRRKLFPVVSAGHLEGFVDTRALAKIPRREWEQHTVAEVMRHDLNDLTISPEADALEACAKWKAAASTACWSPRAITWPAS